MSDASSLVRSLLIYGVCLPLAIFLGYLLAMPMDTVSFAMLGILFGILTLPMFLRWHHAWLITFWNANMLAFFLPGKPSFTLVMCVISFGISVLQHILNKRIKFLYVPMIAWPLFFLTAVVFATARLRGGIGLQIAGGENFGGKRYLFILGAVIGYFALTARPIPAHKLKLYISLFFLGALTSAVSNFAGVVSPSLYFLFLIFPADPASLGASQEVSGAGGEMVSRLGGVAGAALALVWFLLAFYGVKGLFQKSWRTALLAVCFVSILFGGYRGHLITFLLTFGIVFYMEGMMRSRALPILLLLAILVGAPLLSFSDSLPFGVQRTMSFLPVRIDPIVAADVKDSTDWRLEMWKYVIPEIPKYLILGKGYTFDATEMAMINSGLTQGQESGAGSALAGDYHNGPLSVIMPFGIFGVIGFLWFLAAGIKVLRQNYRFGDPALEQINRFLLAQFIAKAIFFFVIFGSLYSDLPFFTGIVGLSICINGGMRRGAVPAPVPKLAINKFKLAHANATR